MYLLDSVKLKNFFLLPSNLSKFMRAGENRARSCKTSCVCVETDPESRASCEQNCVLTLKRVSRPTMFLLWLERPKSCFFPPHVHGKGGCVLRLLLGRQPRHSRRVSPSVDKAGAVPCSRSAPSGHKPTVLCVRTETCESQTKV